MKQSITAFLILTVGISLFNIPVATAQSQEDDVISAVQQFFDAMAAADSAATREVLMLDGQYFSLMESPDGLITRRTTNEEYFSGIQTRTDSYLERMWNPEVSITNRIAVLTAPYDFHLNGQFSHCGTDVFTLIRTESGWKIAGIIYTVEPTGCPPSPLGPAYE